MSPVQKDLVIQRGDTFILILRWEVLPLVYKPITGITQTAPAIVTAVGHEVPDGWGVAFESIKGPKSLNARFNPPRGSDFHKSTEIDADNLSFADVNAALLPAYVSGGYVVYYTPQDLAGYTARMKIADKAYNSVNDTQTVFMSLTTENGRISLNNVLKTIIVTITAADTAALDWEMPAMADMAMFPVPSGVYDLELVSPASLVTKLLAGTVSVNGEVTR